MHIQLSAKYRVKNEDLNCKIASYVYDGTIGLSHADT